MCPPWIEGAHAGAPLQEAAFLTSMSATWYQTVHRHVHHGAEIRPPFFDIAQHAPFKLAFFPLFFEHVLAFLPPGSYLLMHRGLRSSWSYRFCQKFFPLIPSPP